MRKASLIILLILLCVVLFSIIAVFKKPLLQIAFLNVGAGNAVLVTTPSGNRILIDGGPDQSVLQALGGEMPFYSRSIDVVLATSQKSSDTGGLPFVLERFNIGAFIDSGLSPKTTTYRTLLDDVGEKNIAHITANIGEDVNLGGGAHFLILSSGAEITGRIVYGATFISIPSDIPATSTSDVVFESDGKNIWEK